MLIWFSEPIGKIKITETEGRTAGLGQVASSSLKQKAAGLWDPIKRYFTSVTIPVIPDTTEQTLKTAMVYFVYESFNNLSID